MSNNNNRNNKSAISINDMIKYILSLKLELQKEEDKLNKLNKSKTLNENKRDSSVTLITKLKNLIQKESNKLTRTAPASEVAANAIPYNGGNGKKSKKLSKQYRQLSQP